MLIWIIVVELGFLTAMALVTIKLGSLISQAKAAAEAKATRIEKVVQRSFLHREDINITITKYMHSGSSEQVHIFYDRYTQNRQVTYLILSNALIWGIPVNLMFSLAYVESRFYPAAVNGDKNADGSADYGLFQLNSSSFSGYDQDYLMNPENNVRLAAAYLREKHERYGNWEEVLLSYNAGNTVRVSNHTIRHFVGVMAYERKLDRAFSEAF